MICVIPAAGKSARFVDKGYEEKPLLPMTDGRTLFQWVLDSLPQWDDLIILTPPGGKVTEHIARQFPDRRNVHIIVVESTTSPLATISKAFQKMYDYNDTLWINYIDTFLWPDAGSHLNKITLDMDACLVTFVSDATRYNRIPNGNLACGGMAYFKNSRDFVSYSRFVAKSKGYEGKGIPNVVFEYPRWHNMIVNLWHDLFDLGTPTDYELFLYGSK